MGDADETAATALIHQLEQLAPRLGGRFVADPEKVRLFEVAAATVRAQAEAMARAEGRRG